MNLTGPCNWPTATCPMCNGCGDVTAAQRAALEAWAVSELWQATGRIYGTCDVTVYPCNDYSTICGVCWNSYRSCGCAWVEEVKLAGPVASVSEVVVDGVTLDNSAYRIDDWQWLVRLDGGAWPANADPTDPEAFAVTYALGEAPPAGAAEVTGMLVCARSICAESGCSLPRGTTQVSRQGVTMVKGNTAGTTSSRPWRYETNTMSIFGIDEVDTWVRNAQYPVRAGAVHSPDLPTVRQTTWVAPSSP